MTNKEIALATLAEHIAQAEAAGLGATAKSWQDHYAVVQARPDNEIIVAATRLQPTSTSPGSWSRATENA